MSAKGYDSPPAGTSDSGLFGTSGSTDVTGPPSNASAEGWNSKIRMLSHRAFGFHSADGLIGMIHLCFAGLVIKPDGYS
jgi:Transposase